MMRLTLYIIVFFAFAFCSCSDNKQSAETHYADKDYSLDTGLETFDHNLAVSIDEINRHNPFKTDMGVILKQVLMEDESIVYHIELDDEVTSKDVNWQELDRLTKEGAWEFLGEHSTRVKFFTQCALSGRFLVYEYYEGTKKVHSTKIWPGDYIEDIIY